MAIVPGFEYDIFISYRHNDNLDGWVTDFVQNLEKELKGTLKDTVTIYFDKNPNDGLLETHNVDKTLEGKLKCLIFIPIISQTYCDPKRFAWQHEFCAFNKLAKEDPFGRDIKLSNGNVASRILPVKIHDLDAEDKVLLENELGGVLRSIEFIFKSAGVNRPLTPSDNPEKNLNKTFYRDQINKVANAIKEIVICLKNFDAAEAGLKPSVPFSSLTESRPKPLTRKLLANSAAVLLVMLLAGYLIFNFTNIGKKVSPRSIEMSVAVLPFENMSDDPDQEYFSDGMSEEIINSLAHVKELKVAGRTSSFQFKGKNPDLKEVGEKLGVRTVLEGSVRKQGAQLRITVQLIDVNDGYHLWSERFDRNISDVFAIQDEIAAAVTDKLKATLFKVITKYEPNQQAYDLYLKGRYFWNKRGKDLLIGLEYFKQAVAADSLFPLAHSGMAESYVLIGRYDMAKPNEIMPLARQAAETAIRLDQNCSEAHTALAYEMMIYEWNWLQAEKMFKKAIEVNPNYVPAHYLYGNFLSKIKGDLAKATEEGQRAIELEPLNPICHFIYAISLQSAGNYPDALAAVEKAIELDNNSLTSIHVKGQILIKMSRYEEATQVLQTGIEKLGRSQWLLAALCEGYALSGKEQKALKIYKELKERSASEYISQLLLATSAQALKKNKEATGFYRKSLEEHSSGLEILVKDDPDLRLVFEKLK